MLDFEGVEGTEYHQAGNLFQILMDAARFGQLTVIAGKFHQFQETQEDTTLQGGATVVLLLAESHISAHTWPEFNKIIIDLFSCGPEMQAEEVIQYMIKAIPNSECQLSKVVRGD